MLCCSARLKAQERRVVRLRLKRFGRTHKPYYRLNAIDQRNPRDGRSLEELGQYDPTNRDESKQINFNAERVQYWLSVGAQPSQTVAGLLKRAGITPRSAEASAKS